MFQRFHSSWEGKKREKKMGKKEKSTILKALFHRRKEKAKEDEK